MAKRIIANLSRIFYRRRRHGVDVEKSVINQEKDPRTCPNEEPGTEIDRTLVVESLYPSAVDAPPAQIDHSDIEACGKTTVELCQKFLTEGGLFAQTELGLCY